MKTNYPNGLKTKSLEVNGRAALAPDAVTTPDDIVAAAVITAATTDTTAAKLTDVQALRTKVNEIITAMNTQNTVLETAGIYAAEEV